MADKDSGLKESEIQTLILAFLLTKGLYVWRNQSQGTWDAKAGKYRALNQVGAKRGTPDILGILPDGRFLGIECKSAAGRVSPDQNEFIRQANMLGGLAFVARGLDDVKEHLETYVEGGSLGGIQKGDA